MRSMMKSGAWQARVPQPIVLLAVGLAATLVLDSAAGAEGTPRPAGTWNVIAEARGVSPYAEVPSEQSGGGPFLRAELDSVNFTAPAYAFGTLGYPSYLAQEGALVAKDKPGDVNASSSPDSKYRTAERFAPFGEAGPYVAVQTAHDLSAHGLGAYRIWEAGGARADGGFSSARTFFSEELGAMVAEATSHVMGLTVGDKLHISNFESWVRLTFPRDAEPTVDYRLAMTGVGAGGKDVAGWSTRSESDASSARNRDVVVSGQGIGIGKVVEDFADKMNEQGNIPNLMRGGIYIDKPRVSKEGSYYRLAGAALELRSNNAPRKNQFGQVTALRFGDSAVQGYFSSIA